MPPQVDLVIVFRVSPPQPGVVPSKEQVRQNTAKSERQYTALIDTLTRAGLKAVGRRGENQDQLLIMVACPREVLAKLVHCERYASCTPTRWNIWSYILYRYSDFLYGLPMSKLPSADTDLDATPLSPADRIRLVHAYITSTPQDGGLGIVPECNEWDFVQSVMALHDHDFNEKWIRLWTTHRIASVQLEKIRDQVHRQSPIKSWLRCSDVHSVSSVTQSLCTSFSSRRIHVPLFFQLFWASCFTSSEHLIRHCTLRSFSYGRLCS